MTNDRPEPLENSLRRALAKPSWSAAAFAASRRWRAAIEKLAYASPRPYD